VTVPALIVVCPLEGRPLVYVDALGSREELGVLDWLASTLVLVDAATALLALLNDLLQEGLDEEPGE
jgi:hypothetical protein